MNGDKRTSRRRHGLWLVCCLTMLLVPCWSFPSSWDLKRDPADIVREYTRLDFKGARLESNSQEVLHPYTEWTEEPVWGAAIVVRNYTVVGDTKEWEIVSPMEAVIPVDYEVLGKVYWETGTFLSESRAERVGFRVKGRSHRWQVIEPHIPPHVGIKRMIYFVRHQMVQETDPSRRKRLATLRKELEEAKARGSEDAG